MALAQRLLGHQSRLGGSRILLGPRESPEQGEDRQHGGQKDAGDPHIGEGIGAGGHRIISPEGSRDEAQKGRKSGIGPAAGDEVAAPRVAALDEVQFVPVRLAVAGEGGGEALRLRVPWE